MPITWDDGFPLIGLPGNLRKAPNTWLKPDTGFTQDTPEGNYADLERSGTRATTAPGAGLRTFARVAKDVRVWALFLVYGCCFGVELTINNVAALYGT